MTKLDYLTINKKSWNDRVDTHVKSDFYRVEAFLAGENSLKEIELALLGDVKGKRILHLQCHFGQDSISLQRMGAQVTGVDFSDKAIGKARELANQTKMDTQFICCDIYELPNHLNETFDMVFTSYGTIGWLPDVYRWAEVVNRFLKPGGEFVFVDFHPVVWMYDDHFDKIVYSYFNTGPIEESQTGTYAEKEAEIEIETVGWNHHLGEVLGALLQQNLVLKSFNEYNYSPYDCFKGGKELSPGKYYIPHMGNNIPMVYALTAKKNH